MTHISFDGIGAYAEFEGVYRLTQAVLCLLYSTDNNSLGLSAKRRLKYSCKFRISIVDVGVFLADGSDDSCECQQALVDVLRFLLEDSRCIGLADTLASSQIDHVNAGLDKLIVLSNY